MRQGHSWSIILNTGLLYTGGLRGRRGGLGWMIWSWSELSRIWSPWAHLGLSVVRVKMIWAVVKLVCALVNSSSHQPLLYRGGLKVSSTLDASGYGQMMKWESGKECLGRSLSCNFNSDWGGVGVGGLWGLKSEKVVFGVWVNLTLIIIFWGAREIGGRARAGVRRGRSRADLGQT